MTVEAAATGMLPSGPVPGVPGASFRPWRGHEDLAGMAAANNAARLAAGVAGWVDLDELRAQYANLVHSDLATDLLLVEAGGEIVGYSRVSWSDQTDGTRAYELVQLVHPDWAGRGIEPALLNWADDRRRTIAAGHRGAPPRWLGAFTFDGETALAGALTDAGYDVRGRTYEMERSSLDDVEVIAMPDGLVVRPVEPTEIRAVWDAMVEAFADHPGERDATEAHWRQFVDNPRLDPARWVIAFDGDAVAGGVLTDLAPESTPAGRGGWLEEVFVRAPWRRRGLARALMSRAFVLLRSRGATHAFLGVDGANPSQAMTLYESMGFRIASSGTQWSKPIDPLPDAAGQEARHG